jgi:hypothetical protein
MSLDPPAIQNTQAGDAVEGRLHAAGSGRFVGLTRVVQPQVYAAQKQAGPAHIVVLDVYNGDDVAQSSGGVENTADEGLALFITGMGFSSINNLEGTAAVAQRL